MELHRSRGKRLARERIDGLVDANTPFLELSPPAAWDMYDGEVASAGIITGVAGVPALSIPCGFAAENLPLSLQLVSKSIADGLLLRLAHAYQQVHRLAPPPLPAGRVIAV